VGRAAGAGSISRILVDDPQAPTAPSKLPSNWDCSSSCMTGITATGRQPADLFNPRSPGGGCGRWSSWVPSRLPVTTPAAGDGPWPAWSPMGVYDVVLGSRIIGGQAVAWRHAIFINTWPNRCPSSGILENLFFLADQSCRSITHRLSAPSAARFLPGSSFCSKNSGRILSSTNEVLAQCVKFWFPHWRSVPARPSYFGGGNLLSTSAVA